MLTIAWFRKKKTIKEDDRNGRSFVNTLRAVTEKVWYPTWTISDFL